MSIARQFGLDHDDARPSLAAAIAERDTEIVRLKAQSAALARENEALKADLAKASDRTHPVRIEPRTQADNTQRTQRQIKEAERQKRLRAARRASL